MANQPTLTPGRRIYGAAGTSLTTSGMDADAVRLGIKGEEMTAEKLSEIITKYPNAYVFHSVKLPGWEGDIDHLIVQYGRIILLDSKFWAGNKDYSYGRKDAQGKQTILKDGAEFPGGALNLDRQRDMWTDENPAYKVTTVVTITNNTATVNPKNNTRVHNRVNLTPFPELESTLDRLLTTDPNTKEIPEPDLRRFLSLCTNNNFTPLSTVTYRHNGSVIRGVRTRAQKWVTALANTLIVWSILNYIASMGIGWSHAAGTTAPGSFITGGLLLVAIIITYILMARYGVQIKKRLTITLIFTIIYLAAWGIATAGRAGVFM